MAGVSHNSYLGNKGGGRGGQRKEVHFTKGVSEEGWSDSFVCAEEGFSPLCMQIKRLALCGTNLNFFLL